MDALLRALVQPALGSCAQAGAWRLLEQARVQGMPIVGDLGISAMLADCEGRHTCIARGREELLLGMLGGRMRFACREAAAVPTLHSAARHAAVTISVALRSAETGSAEAALT